MKSIERSHAPKDLWERVKEKSLELIDKHLVCTLEAVCAPAMSSSFFTLLSLWTH